jgi:hypothetical protein
MLAAVAVTPSSTVVQMATSAVLKRNSPLKSLRVWTKGVRMMVAVLPLLNQCVSHLSFLVAVYVGKTYKAAKPKMEITKTLVCFFICSFLTIKKGKSPNVQSATEFKTDTTYVRIMMTSGLMHFPW